MSTTPRAVSPVAAACVLALAVASGVGLVVGWPKLSSTVSDLGREGPGESDPAWIVEDFRSLREPVPWNTAVQPVDGHRLLVGRPSGRVDLIRLDTQPTSTPVQQLPTRVMDIATSDDGATAAAIDLDGNVVVWRGGERLASGQLDSVTYSGMAVDARGSRFAAVGFSIKIWDLPAVRVVSSAVRPTMPGGTGTYAEARFLDSRLLAVDLDGLADAWSVDERRAVLERVLCNCVEGSAAWSADGRIVAFGTLDGRLVLQDANTDVRLSDQTVDFGPGSFVHARAVLDPGHVLVSTSRTPLAVWSVDERELIWRAPTGYDVQYLGISPDQSAVAAVLNRSEPDGSFASSMWAGRIVHGGG